MLDGSVQVLTGSCSWWPSRDQRNLDPVNRAEYGEEVLDDDGLVFSGEDDSMQGRLRLDDLLHLARQDFSAVAIVDVVVIIYVVIVVEIAVQRVAGGSVGGEFLKQSKVLFRTADQVRGAS